MAKGTRGMHYCFDGGGHIVWDRLIQVVVGRDKDNRPIVELLCARHARPEAR